MAITAGRTVKSTYMDSSSETRSARRPSATPSSSSSRTRSTAPTPVPSSSPRTNPPKSSTKKPSKSVKKMPLVTSTPLHKKLSAKPTSVSKSPISPNRPDLPYIPTELLFDLFEGMSTEQVTRMRAVCKRYAAVATVVLLDRFRKQLPDLATKRIDAVRILRRTERERYGHLGHYRNFLRNISSTELTEATWYATPPPELQTVCECLCILKGTDGGAASRRRVRQAFGDDRDEEDSFIDGAMPWPTIKKLMTRYEFKTWLMNLQVGVDFIPFANVKRVERLIMVDPSITYDRLREVSMAGYRLLILVAACLQYCTIAEDLRIKRRECVRLETNLVKMHKFVAVVGGPGDANEVGTQIVPELATAARS